MRTTSMCSAIGVSWFFNIYTMAVQSLLRDIGEVGSHQLLCLKSTFKFKSLSRGLFVISAMKTKTLLSTLLLGSVLLSSCTVSYLGTDKLMENYEKKIHHTTLIGKALFKFDKKKLDTYNNVQVFFDGNDVKGEYEVVAYGKYTPVSIPLLRPERKRLEKYLLWKAARKARKLGANGVVINNKNNFTVIQIKK